MLMAIYLRKEFRFFVSLFFLFLLFCCCIEDIRNLFVSVPTQTSVRLTDCLYEAALCKKCPAGAEAGSGTRM